MAFHYPINGGGGGGGVTDLNGLTGAVTLSAGNNVTLNESGNDIEITANFTQDGKYMISGGITWSGTGLTYDVSFLNYFFNGNKTANPTQVTLAASDPTNNRFDAIVVDELGTITTITGTASANPEVPAIPEDQLQVTIILVAAGSTTPTITSEEIYMDDPTTGWTFSTYTTGTPTGSINFAGTNSPKQGVNDIEASADARLGARFVRGTSFDAFQYTMLQVWVRFTGTAVATNKSLNVRFENSAGTLVANTVNLFNYGLQRGVLNTWQLVVVPITAFGALPATVKGLKVIMAGGTVGVVRQWDIDYMILTNGSVPFANVPTIAFYKDNVGIASQSGLNIKEGLGGTTITGVNNPTLQTVDYTFNAFGGDELSYRDSVTNYTEIAREYDSTVLDKQFTGTGFDNLNIDSITNQVDTTVTIDSQNNFAGIFSGSTTSNDASVNYAAYTGQRPIQFTFGIDATNDELSTGSGGFTGTPINGEVFNDGLGNSFKFISYDIGTDTIYAYSVVGNVVGVYTGSNSGATVTLVNTFTTGSSEVGIWLDSLGNNGVWSIVITVPYTIGTGANTLDVTLTSNGHNNGDFWSTTFVTGGIIYDVQSQSGALTQGETLTGSLGTTATFAFQYSGGGQQIVLTNIVGSLASGNSAETFTGSLSGNTVLFSNQVTYVDTYSATDGVSTITQIPTESESNQSLFGNITINWGSETGHNIGDQWVIAFVPVTLTTGFESNQVQFPNVPFPLEASAIVATDGTDKMAVGVFDLSPFGQDKLTAGIVSFYDDGSQSTFTESKGFANLNLFDATTNKSMNVSYSGDIFELSGNNGSGSFGIQVSPGSFQYQVNSTNFTLPAQVNGAGYVVTDVNGDGVLTLEPASGGGSSNPNGSIQVSDGAGGFDSSANFLYVPATNLPTWNLADGIYIQSGSDYRFGRFDSTTSKNYFAMNNTGQMQYITTKIPTPVVTFTPAGVGTGADNYSSTGLDNYNLTTPTTYTVTIDTVPYESPAYFVTAGLNDITFTGTNTSGKSLVFSITISTTGATDQFDWVDSEGNSGTNVNCDTSPILLSNGISIQFASITGHTVNDNWVKGYDIGAITFTTTPVSGSFAFDEGVTQISTGATGVLKYNSGGGLTTLTNIVGDFDLGDTIEGDDTGAILSLDNLSLGYGATGSMGDTFEWTDGTDTVGSNPIFTGYGIGMSHNIVANFSGPANHAIGDEWEFTVTPVNLVPIQWQPNNNILALGDYSGFANSTFSIIDDNNKTIENRITNTFSVTNGTGYKFLNIQPAAGLYGIGALEDGNGTKVVINDVAKSVSLYGAVTTPTMDTSTGGGITMADGTSGLYYDPGSVEATATIVLPINPRDGQEIGIFFGGTITTGNPVVTALTIDPNTNSIVGNVPPGADSGNVLRFKYRLSNTKWYRDN